MLLTTEMLPEVHDKPRQSLKRGHGGNRLKLQDPAGPFLKQQREAEIFFNHLSSFIPIVDPRPFCRIGNLYNPEFITCIYFVFLSSDHST